MSPDDTGNVPSPSQLPTPSSTHTITRGHSCLACQRRKIRCNGQRPCSACLKFRRECVAKGPTVSRERRVKAQPKDEVLTRLQRCESLLRKYGVDIDAEINESSEVRNERSLESVFRPPAPSSETGKLIVEKGHSRYIEK